MSETSHLDDEALSAVLDGEATPAESAHADACPECSASLAALRDASLLVRAPVPPAADADRERAITAALAAAPTDVVALAGRRRVPPAWLAAAAALVVAVAAVAVLGRGGDDNGDGDLTATGGDETAESAGDDAITMMAPPSLVDGGDLGDIDVAALEDVIRGALLGDTAATAEEDAAATTTAAGADGAGAGRTEAGGVTTCEAEIRTANPHLGQLTYRATGTLESEPVVVLVFDVVTAEGDLDRWVFVAATAGCDVRNQQTLRG